MNFFFNDNDFRLRIVYLIEVSAISGDGVNCSLSTLPSSSQPTREYHPKTSQMTQLRCKGFEPWPLSTNLHLPKAEESRGLPKLIPRTSLHISVATLDWENLELHVWPSIERCCRRWPKVIWEILRLAFLLRFLYQKLREGRRYQDVGEINVTTGQGRGFFLQNLPQWKSRIFTFSSAVPFFSHCSCSATSGIPGSH